MGDKEEPVLRFGEWAARNVQNYYVSRTVLVPDSDNYDTSKVVFRKETLYHIDPHRLVEMLKDYDKYLDDRLVI